MTDTHAEARERLTAERSQLRKRVDELSIGTEAELEFDADFADRGQVSAEIGENLSLAETLENQLRKIERALARIDEGTYGTCEVCGDDINPDRLDILPATPRCTEHA